MTALIIIIASASLFGACIGVGLTLWSGWLNRKDKSALRDELAGRAMQGMISTGTGYPSAMSADFHVRASKKAYQIADTMLEERSKQP